MFKILYLKLVANRLIFLSRLLATKILMYCAMFHLKVEKLQNHHIIILPMCIFLILDLFLLAHIVD